MSVIGSPAQMSALQAVQAQQAASKARDREKAQSVEKGGRFEDLVELRIAGVATADAVRQLPQNNSEQAQTEHDANHPPPDSVQRLDVTA